MSDDVYSEISGTDLDDDQGYEGDEGDNDPASMDDESDATSADDTKNSPGSGVVTGGYSDRRSLDGSVSETATIPVCILEMLQVRGWLTKDYHCLSTDTIRSIFSFPESTSSLLFVFHVDIKKKHLAAMETVLTRQSPVPVRVVLIAKKASSHVQQWVGDQDTVSFCPDQIPRVYRMRSMYVPAYVIEPSTSDHSGVFPLMSAADPIAQYLGFVPGQVVSCLQLDIRRRVVV